MTLIMGHTSQVGGAFHWVILGMWLNGLTVLQPKIGYDEKNVKKETMSNRAKIM